MIDAALLIPAQFVAGLIWGSFLNVVGHRVITGTSIVSPRSRCPQCKAIIFWYDLIPVISWILLGGKCRSCGQTISALYPLIEVFTAITMLLITHLTPSPFHISYFFFASILLVITRSDLEFMLISRYTTLFAIPFAFLFSKLEILPLTLFEVARGALFGYFSLYLIARLFLKITRKSGVGQGDVDMLALIGAFTGIIGCWATLLFGSIIGTICGTIYIFVCQKSTTMRLPFGPFLAIGSLIYILFQNQTIYLLLGENANLFFS